jgi:hypothetical protein
MLQRQCACGRHTVAGECAECRARRETGGSQRAVRRPAERSPVAGAFRAPVLPRFGHDFSKIPVSSTSARAGHARSAAAGGGDQPGATPESVGPAEAAATTAAATDEVAAAPGAAAGAGLSWSHVLRFAHDALWWFCGERPAGFSTTALLRATGFGDPTQLHWRITRGASKVAFAGAATGEEVTVRSTAGSTRADDVTIEVREGTGAGAPTFSGNLTVRKPHRLMHRSDTDHAACPTWAATACGTCPAYWTEVNYRVVDNVGGTIVGATVNENFPGGTAKTNDQPNDWTSPAAFITVPFWRNTNGTFPDNWFKFCGTPSPVAPGAPGAGTGVDRIAHEFYVGSETPGRGCRVQTHTAHRYLGFTRHEGITSPAP